MKIPSIRFPRVQLPRIRLSRRAENAILNAFAGLIVTAVYLLAVIAIIIATYAFLGAITTWAWNTALVPLLHVPHFTFWISVAIWVLITLVNSALRDIAGTVFGAAVKSVLKHKKEHAI